MRRTSRRLIAIVTLFGLLVVHGAVAAHACTAMLDPLGALVPAASTGASDGDCAENMDKADPALCLHHCSQGHDASSTGNAADVPGPVLTPCINLVAATPLPVTLSPRAATQVDTRTTSPPPLLLSQRLRI